MNSANIKENGLIFVFFFIRARHLVIINVPYVKLLEVPEATDLAKPKKKIIRRIERNYNRFNGFVYIYITFNIQCS